MVRIYFAGYRAIRRFIRVMGFKRFARVTGMFFSGFWLGILSREHLHAIGELKYSTDRKYWTDEWNKGGLRDWEREVLERDFAGRKKLLVAAAGGGREVLALRRVGFDVEGFDSDPGLVHVANDLLKREGMVPDIKTAPWDHCPNLDGKYDGLIVGWSAYMLIRGREKRIGFLRELRTRVVEGAPLLLSFYIRDENSRYFRGVARIANILTVLMGRDRIELGDELIPNFAHSFTRREIEAELGEGGFQLISFETRGYGHAVGRAV